VVWPPSKGPNGSPVSSRVVAAGLPTRDLDPGINGMSRRRGSKTLKTIAYPRDLLLEPLTGLLERCIPPVWGGSESWWKGDLVVGWRPFGILGRGLYPRPWGPFAGGFSPPSWPLLSPVRVPPTEVLGTSGEHFYKTTA